MDDDCQHLRNLVDICSFFIDGCLCFGREMLDRVFSKIYDFELALTLTNPDPDPEQGIQEASVEGGANVALREV